MIIVIAGEKGGTGKTALAFNLSVCMLARGHDVLLVDGDKQRSSAKFAERRAALAEAGQPIVHLPCIEKRGDMASALESLSPKYSHLIVDVRGAETPQLSSALMMADRVYSPFAPGVSDLETAQAMNHAVELAKARGNRMLESFAVLNKIAPGAARASELERCHQMLDPFAHNLPIISTVVHYRSIFSKADAYGVVEYAAHKSSTVRRDAAKSTAELWSLYTEVTGEEVAATREEVHDHAFE